MGQQNSLGDFIDETPKTLIKCSFRFDSGKTRHLIIKNSKMNNKRNHQHNELSNKYIHIGIQLTFLLKANKISKYQNSMNFVILNLIYKFTTKNHYMRSFCSF